MQRFEAYEDGSDRWRWRLWGANERIVASSGESFGSKVDALRAAEGVKATAPNATISIAPGLGIKAAVRLRALLATPDGDDRVASGLRRRRVRAARGTKPRSGAPVRGLGERRSRDLLRQGWR